MLRVFAPLSFLAATCAKQPQVFPRTAAFVSALGGLSRSEIFESKRKHRPHTCVSRVGGFMTTAAHPDGVELPYRYRWPRPAVTVDCLVYTMDQGEPWILLIKRKNDPFKGAWALPGGFVDENEGLEIAARRELEEETGVTGCALVQTGAYGDPGRDPRGHTITVAFMAWAPSKASCGARAGDDAAEAEFYPVKRLPRMAFDHFKVISEAWSRCTFQSGGTGVDDSEVTVTDRGTAQALCRYSSPGLTAEGLNHIQPVERGTA